MTKTGFSMNTVLALAFTCFLMLAHPSQAQDQHYYCSGFYNGARWAPSNWQLETRFLTGVFEAVGEHARIDQAWLNYLTSKYGGRPSGMCSAGDPTSLEKLVGLYSRQHPVIRVDWKYTPEQDVRVPSPSVVHAPAADGNTVIVKGFIYCYSEPSAGMNTYFSDVFRVELPAYAHPRGPIPDDASVNRIKEAFYSYLKRKGYTFKPGTSNCEFGTDEQTAKALKHRRAYEGGPCSTCGKVVETGWRYGSPP